MSDEKRVNSAVCSAPLLSPTLDGRPFPEYLEKLLLDAGLAVCRFPKGEMIFAEGDRGDAAYFIRAGSIDILGRGHDGSERLLNHLCSGELFGEMALLDQARRSASAIASDATELIVIPREEVAALLQRVPPLALWMLRLFSHRLRLLTRMVAQMEEVHEVNFKILAGQEDERQRISRDIHDGVAQAFVAYIARLEIADQLLDQDVGAARTELADLQDGLREGLEKIRELMYNLYPRELGRVGLVGAIERFVERVAASNGLKVSFESRWLDAELPAALEATLYCIVQEALNNVRRHANASKVRLDLRCEGAQVIMHIVDDGCGFDVGAVLGDDALCDSYGLLSMEERAKLAGGSMELDSSPGAGTRLRFLIPVPACRLPTSR